MRRQFRENFLPAPENDYTPPVLQRVAMLVMAVMVVFTFAAANLHSLLWISSDWLVSTILPAVIVEKTNEKRADDALVTLRRNEVLDAAATLKAQHMAKNEYFAHFSPDGVSPWHWFNQVSYQFAHAGENLAIHFTDSGEVVEAWMKSPTHRANIMNGEYTEIGVGTARGEYEGYPTVYVVQLFGTPAVPPRPPEPEPEPELVPAPVAVIPTETPEPEIVSAIPSSTVLAASSPAEPVEVEVAPVVPVNPIVEEPAESAVELVLEKTQEVVPTSTLAALASSTEATTTATEIVEMTFENDTVALYSGTISTSSGLLPAILQTGPADGESTVPVLAKYATEPSAWLEYTYAAMGIFVVFSLLLSILVEIREQRPVQIAYATGLLILMGGLYYFHTLVTAGALIA